MPWEWWEDKVHACSGANRCATTEGERERGVEKERERGKGVKLKEFIPSVRRAKKKGGRGSQFVANWRNL